MGIRFRKSFSLGPFRINLSKSGIGFSVGTKGMRFTKKASGGSQVSASLPGTGLSYVKTIPSDAKKGKNAIWYVVAAVIIVISIGGFLITKLPKKVPAATETKPVAAVTEAASASQDESGTYILNTDSKKFHLSGCSSAESISDAKKDTFTGSRTELIDQGYAPCGRCDP